MRRGCSFANQLQPKKDLPGCQFTYFLMHVNLQLSGAGYYDTINKGFNLAVANF